MYTKVPHSCRPMEVTIAAMRCPFSTLELVKALTDKKNIDPNALLLAAAIAPRGDQIGRR